VDDSGSKKNDASLKPLLFHRVAKVLVLGRIYRVEARKNHRFHFLKAGQRFGDRTGSISYGVADLNVGNVLIDAVRNPTSPAPSSSISVGRGRLTPMVSTRYSRPCIKNLILVPFFIVPSMILNKTITPR
jgi:hypothetical protein